MLFRLRRIAPEFQPHGGPLVPTRNTGNSMNTFDGGAARYEKQPRQQSRSVMDD